MTTTPRPLTAENIDQLARLGIAMIFEPARLRRIDRMLSKTPLELMPSPTLGCSCGCS